MKTKDIQSERNDTKGKNNIAIQQNQQHQQTKCEITRTDLHFNHSIHRHTMSYNTICMLGMKPIPMVAVAVFVVSCFI